MSTPTREERPKSWKGRLADFALQLLITILGVVIGIMLTPFTPWFDQAVNRWHYVEPTCGDPRGLEILDVAAMTAKGEATVEVSSKSEEEKTEARC